MLRAIYSGLFFISIFTLPHKTFGDSLIEKSFQELKSTPRGGILDIFSPPKYATDLKKEVDTLKERLEKMESQQKEMMTSLNIAKNELGSTKEELKNVENSRTESKELEHILIHYGNNPDGMSALHYAIKMGDITAVNTLIANGADVNSIDLVFQLHTKFIALVRAVNCNQIEIARLLLNLGADVNLTPYDDYSYYPIHYAAKSGSGDLIKLLIENGAILNKICPKHDQNNAKTPLHSACEVGNYEAVIALFNGGAKIDGNISPNVSVNHWNNGTPLDWAANS